ncbi:MAG: tyrosine-type recombinase/integrase [Methylobacterium sp.]|nr:tyrosine-type recombinase/integrase [Methylobacterium sp.]
MYWWRRRLACLDGTTVVALSLNEREPSRAISLAIAMTAASEDVMQFYPVGSARHQLQAHLASLHLATRQRIEEDRLTVLAAFARGDRKADQLLKERRSQARIYATLNRIAAVEGDTVVDPIAAIRKHGVPWLTEFEIDKILHRLERGYAREAYRPGSGVANVPDLTMLDRAVMEEGSHNDEAVRSICAELAARRAEIECEASQLYTKVLNSPEKPVTKGEPRVFFDNCDNAWERPAHQMVDRIASEDILIAITDEGSAVLPGKVERREATRRPAQSRQSTQQTVATAIAQNDAATGRASFEVEITIEKMVEDLIATSEWGEKTAAQVRSVAHLFTRMAGCATTKALTEQNFLRYRTLLTTIPVNYGKSPKDFEGSLHSVIENAKASGKSVGLSKQTINRHLTQIEAIYAFGASLKICDDWSELIKSRRPMVKKRDKCKKVRFEDADAKIIFGQQEWSMRAVLPDASLYWGVLIAAYTGARQAEIAGLKLVDIDADGEVIHIRRNANRDVKTEAGERSIPIHSELLRLGFLRYVRTVQARARMDADLFPDLRARGSRTSHGVLLGKSFAKIMNRSGLKKKKPGLSFHSWRHAANTKMASASDAVREQILGHEGETINTSVYMHEIERMTIKQALELVKWDTVHLVPLRWNNWIPPSPATLRSPRSKRPAQIKPTP